MGLQREGRQSHRHETVGVQALAGVHSEDYYEYQPLQHVMTTDGFPGVVTAVHDGPHPGAEDYEVTLDGGMGGGSYTASQLSPAPVSTAALEGTAAADYPELSRILVDRPDPALQQVYAAASNSFADDDADSKDDTDDSASDDDSDKDSDEEAGNDSDDDSETPPPWAKSAALFDRLIAMAVADIDFRFHVTASWRDVVAKAKRLRAEGRLRVTLASDGLVVAEVKGDHHVYETGLQRLPGRTAVQSWTCGCKWGAYHWGADDDYSRFAGRMCSHALALTYEAQSRGMFGHDVRADETKPTWVPRKVVIRYDIDADTNRLVPSTAKASPQTAPARALLQSLARAAVAAGENAEEFSMVLRAVGVTATWEQDEPEEEEDEEGTRFHRDEWGDPVYKCHNKHCYDGEHSDGETKRAHEGVYTDWDSVHPHLGNTLHRGMAVSLPGHVADVVHDDSRPVADRAHALSEHLREQGMGTHWTPDKEQAQHYSGVSDSRKNNTHVVLHAHTPPKEHIETDPDELVAQDVISMGDHDDGEVPLRSGAPVSLKGISWRQRGNGPWVRHDFDNPHPHTASVAAPFGEPSAPSYQTPHPSGATHARVPWENPGSAGPLATADPTGWGRTMPMEQVYASAHDAAIFEPGGPEAMLHDEPEGALPATDGTESTDNDMPLAPAMSGLRTHALKDFTLAERQALINEGDGTRAANLDRLQIAGTHYEDLEQALASQEDTTWLA
ncbi:hypothetical protein ACFZAM_31170 [Streptomyces sp. NPDC008079]|uniref:hypothetical protein n=1 Tax=Streptomyces sp. NPDC008079 TaxID=3364806 RepID=UPI0036F0027B